MDRRGFLRASGLTLAALALRRCQAARVDLSTEERYIELQLSYLDGFAAWLDGRPGFIGEVGWPRTSDRGRWDALGRTWLLAATLHGFWIAYWASGPWPSDYALLAHEGNPLHTTHFPGRALEETPRPYPECNGINLAGWEWDDDNHPRPESFHYLAERDITLVRVPFAWERVQPVTGEELGPGAQRMVEISDAAHAAGCRVVWDCHNYEQVHHWFGGERRLMRTDEFVDLWTRLSERLEGHPGVAGYSLMNEPNPHTGSDPHGWEERSQACVTALRDRGDDQRVFVGTFHWSNINRVARKHPDGPWIRDPADNTVYEAHQYFDFEDGGTYPRSYDDYAQQAASR